MSPCPTTLPRRITVTRSHSCSISSSLWETKITIMPVGGEPAQDLEQLLALRCGDPGRRLVEDQHPGAEPEQPGDLELLAFADGQGLRERAADRT